MCQTRREEGFWLCSVFQPAQSRFFIGSMEQSQAQAAKKPKKSSAPHEVRQKVIPSATSWGVRGGVDGQQPAGKSGRRTQRVSGGKAPCWVSVCATLCRQLLLQELFAAPAAPKELCPQAALCQSPTSLSDSKRWLLLEADWPPHTRLGSTLPTPNSRLCLVAVATRFAGFRALRVAGGGLPRSHNQAEAELGFIFVVRVKALAFTLVSFGWVGTSSSGCTEVL